MTGRGALESRVVERLARLRLTSLRLGPRARGSLVTAYVVVVVGVVVE